MASENGESTSSPEHLSMVKWWREGLSDEEIAEKLRTSVDEISAEGEALKLSLGGGTEQEAVDMAVAQLLRRTQNELKEARAALAVAIVSPTDLAVLGLDSNGNVKTVCRQSAKMLGVPAADLYGKPIDTILARRGKGVDQSTTEMAQAEETGLPSYSERKHTRSDGSTFQAHHTVMAVIGPLGGTTGFFRSIRDLTKQRMIELHIEALEVSIALLLDEPAAGPE